MSKEYRSTRMPRPQMFLLPPCLDDFVDKESPVRVFAEIIDSLDMSGLVLDPSNRSRARGRGAPGYDPRLLFKVLAFAYSDGIRSSRRIETAVRYDMRYLWLSEMTPLDHVTLCRFRKENAEAFRALFKETVQLCRRLGLVLLKEVAVDGTKLEANVSGKETFGHKRLREEEARLDRAIDQLLREADQADEGAAPPTRGEDLSPDGLVAGELLVTEVPPELRDARRRKERIEKARQEMERSCRKAVAATDPESRVMKFGGRRRPAYNAQAVVDSSCQVIVGANVVSDENDSSQLPPMLEQVQETLGVTLKEEETVLLADAGYWSQPTLEWIDNEGVDAYVRDIQAPIHNRPDPKAGYRYDADRDCFIHNEGRVLTFWKEREKEGRHYRVFRDRNRAKGLPKKELWLRIGDERTSLMRQKLATEEGQAIYRRRQQIVEPVFGHMKVAYNLRRLLLRGIKGARTEFLLACIAHNLGKIRLSGLVTAQEWAAA